MFFASLSTFDERSLEDSKVNRLEDSLLLWRAICGSRLLKKAGLILCLTKQDVLQRKLQAGSKVRDYFPSYGDRPNHLKMIVKYFQVQFKTIAKDVNAPGIVVATVRDIILRGHLKNGDLM
ncbi:hypothetical protein EST38_g6606 [Candolleomyces aberdarensis]|uniref:Uncharacterized protein n=1 Tax=Candolleomyces aberdarensis TaxID=2316362 RepID=A0A4Q2DJ91_9AGAR|nr:hypothetical protein EST38_g6606 [Candolleomyces aberdarensis]